MHLKLKPSQGLVFGIFYRHKQVFDTVVVACPNKSDHVIFHCFSRSASYHIVCGIRLFGWPSSSPEFLWGSFVILRRSAVTFVFQEFVYTSCIFQLALLTSWLLRRTLLCSAHLLSEALLPHKTCLCVVQSRNLKNSGRFIVLYFELVWLISLAFLILTSDVCPLLWLRFSWCGVFRGVNQL